MRNVLIALHEMTDYGWELTREAESTSNTWGELDLWAINHLLEHGSDYLKMGNSMWNIQH